jgi:hypothetical protein
MIRQQFPAKKHCASKAFRLDAFHKHAWSHLGALKSHRHQDETPCSLTFSARRELLMIRKAPFLEEAIKALVILYGLLMRLYPARRLS